MKRLIIIRGFCGSGKSTVAEKLSRKKSWFFLENDNFLWKLNSFSELTKEVYEITFNNMISVLSNCMKTNNDICLEGVLVKREKSDLFDMNMILKIAKKYGYRVISIQMIVEEKEAMRRMKKRNHIVPKWERDMLRLKSIEQRLKDEIVIDTTELTERQVSNQILKIVNSWV